MRNYSTLILVLMLAFNMVSSGQSAELDKGDKAFENFDFEEALFFFETARESSPGDPAITRRIANTYRRMGQIPIAAEWYQKTLQLDASNADDMLRYAEILKVLGQYDEAIEWYEMYAKLKPNDLRAKSHLADKQYYRDLFADSARYSMKKFKINNENPVLGISLFEDEKFLVSAIKLDQAGTTGQMETLPYLDVYVCEFNENEELVNPIRLDKNVNSEFHDGPAYYCFADKTLYITRNNMKGKKVKYNKNGSAILKIYESNYNAGKWTPSAELKFNDDGSSCGLPCLTKDGQTMYFVSDREGGFGGTDLYVCYKSGTGWSLPVNLGQNVNTEGNEMFPFIGDDGYLYFSSDGHAGLGGSDIFSSEKIGEVWQIPLNLGSPINGTSDDFSIVYDKDSDNGFFCSNRGGRGDDDIYFYKHITINNMIIAGTIKANAPNISLAGERIKITKVNSGEVAYQALGEFQNFEFSANAGDMVEIVMMDAEYFDPNKPVVSYEVSETIADPYINLGEQQAELKKMPLHDGQLSMFKGEGIVSSKPMLQGSMEKSGQMDIPDPNITAGNSDESNIHADNSETETGIHPNQNAFNKKLAEADVLFTAGKFKEASEAYAAASALMPGEQYPKEKLAETRAMLDSQKNLEYSKKIETADKLFAAEKWGEAKSAYMAAIILNNEDMYPQNQLKVIDHKIKQAELDALKKKYDKKTDEGDRLFANRKYAEAKAAYKAANAILPDEYYAKNQLLKVDEILSPKKKTNTDTAPKGPSEFELAVPVVDLVALSIDNVVFDYNKTYIREEDKAKLDQIYKLMIDNPETKILIRAHCDSRGSMAYNQSLSMSRAMAVQGYLMQKGIKRERMKAEWFGEQRPLNGCVDDVPCEEDEYEVNRRAEFKLVAK
jgi:outer membrane protein OmpA-like peptidoglycan-associated protein